LPKAYKAPQIVQNIATYVVVITTKNPDEVLLPGMTVVAKRPGALKVAQHGPAFPPGWRTSTSAQRRPEQQRLARTSREFPGRIFVLNPKGQLTLIQLRLGITDGRVTEVLSGDLKEGQPVIIGLAAPRGSTPDATSSLFKFRWR
jgi:HlyD family secretion protein